MSVPAHIDCLERFVFQINEIMTSYASSETLNPDHSLTHSFTTFLRPLVVKSRHTKSGCRLCGSFSVSLLCLACIWCFVCFVLVVSTSAIDCLERLVSEMIYYVWSGTLTPSTPAVPNYCWLKGSAPERHTGLTHHLFLTFGRSGAQD